MKLSMRCKVLGGPGHVIFLPGRKALTGTLVVLLGVSLWLPNFGSGQPWLSKDAIQLAVLWTLAAAFACAFMLRFGTEVELDRTHVHWRTRWLRQLVVVHTKREAVSGIRIRPWLTGPNSRMKRLCFLVELRVTGNELPGSLTLWRGRSERQARRYAEWLSRATLLRMEDAVGDTLEVLLPGAALSPRPMSNGPVPALVRVDATQQQGAAMWILGFVPPLQRRRILVGNFISLLISLFCWIRASGLYDAPLRHFAFVAIVFAQALVILAGWFLLAAKTRIAVAGGQIQVELWWLSLRLHQRIMRQRDVVQVRLQSNRNRAGLRELPSGVVLFFGDHFAGDHAVLLGRGLLGPDLHWLRDWLTNALATTGTADSGTVR